MYDTLSGLDEFFFILGIWSARNDNSWAEMQFIKKIERNQRISGMLIFLTVNRTADDLSLNCDCNGNQSTFRIIMMMQRFLPSVRFFLPLFLFWCACKRAMNCRCLFVVLLVHYFSSLGQLLRRNDRFVFTAISMDIKSSIKNFWRLFNVVEISIHLNKQWPWVMWEKRICAVSFANKAHRWCRKLRNICEEKNKQIERKRKIERSWDMNIEHIIFSHHVLDVRWFSKWIVFFIPKRLSDKKWGNRYAYLSVQFDEWNKAHGWWWTGTFPKTKTCDESSMWE